jgi:diamine N-acetyltransferase
LTKDDDVTSRLSPSDAVSLRAVTEDNLDKILRLQVAEDQRHLVADNATSIAQGCYSSQAWYRAIYAGETPAGFVMLSIEPDKPEYYLWRLMIDRRFQLKGIGRAAMAQIIEHVNSYPTARELLVSYVPEEGSPQPFYARLGFVDTGEIHKGEMIMRLEL